MNGFSDEKYLSNNRIFFCIMDICVKEQKNGIVKWYLTISYEDCQEILTQYLTFFYYNKNGQINRKLENLLLPLLDKKQLPIHNAFLTSKEITFYKDQKKCSYLIHNLDWALTDDPCFCCLHADEQSAV